MEFLSTIPSQTMESQSQFQSQMEENKKKTRKTNYLQDEDEALVKAWLHVYKDSVVGRDQRSTKLWMRVLECFHQILGRTTERNSQGLQNRWQIISHDVSKFCGHYNKIGRLNHSGWNDQMIIDEAKQQFGEIEGPLQPKPVQFYKFKYEHCWLILKDSSKWNNHVLIRNTTKASKKSSNPQSQAIGLDEMGSPPLSTPSPPSSTPLGETVFQNDATVIDKEKWEAKKSFEKEKLEAKKRRIEQKAMHEERKVISQSLMGPTPEQVAYWMLQQSIIVERYKTNGLVQDPETFGSVLGFDY
ncbi:hypothetical protein RHMOL_Rhmol11G0063700 [Rhododendron molle]|uniref:Uncharacterized protein n=1 Tax=Rhododendron molle TaxID=49168 RepID=A0ACC0LPK2_RHOML|nr:hypothetical protein RHMOL_Rhmol11G0063700 [Rhododendron molle]